MTSNAYEGERRPLLPQDKKQDDTTIVHESRILLQYSVPLAAMNFLRTLVQAVSIACLGRLGTRELASANIGNLTVNVLGYAVQVGLISSLDTLANQAIRSSSPKLTSIYTMRAFLVCCIMMPPMFVILWNSASILAFIIPNTDPEMVRLAALYVKITSLGIPPFAASDCLRRYLASMGLIRGSTAVYVFTAPLCMSLNYYLTFHVYGFTGAPLAVTIDYWIIFVIMALYTWLAAPRHAWAGVSMVIFEDLGINFRYAFAGVVSTCSEWYAFEAMDEFDEAKRAAYLGEVPLAVNSIALTLACLFWQTPLALCQASSIRIGNLLGANLPHSAKRASEAAQIYTFVITGITAILIQVLRRHFAQLFSRDPLVLGLFDRMAWLVAVVAFFDGIQGACTGMLKGAGLPSAASRYNLFSYWLVGLPIGALVTLKIQKLEGLWIGMAVAVCFTSSLMLLRIWRCDWDERAKEAQDLIESSNTVAGMNNIETVGSV